MLEKDIREIEDESGVHIFDNTIQEKTLSQKNDLICSQIDHTINLSVTNINLINDSAAN